MRAQLFLFVALAGCSAYDTDIGNVPYRCADVEPLCPEGYSCQDDIRTGEQVCVRNGGSITNDFDCADDSALEPNNLLAEAVATDLTGPGTYDRDGLAICPVGDKDLFALSLAAANQRVVVTIDYQADGATLVGAILNAGGIPIATATPVAGKANQISASAQNLPAGQYYAQIAAEVGGTLTRNNYKVSITVTAP